jgi:hypothetical protein
MPRAVSPQKPTVFHTSSIIPEKFHLTEILHVQLLIYVSKEGSVFYSVPDGQICVVLILTQEIVARAENYSKLSVWILRNRWVE